MSSPEEIKRKSEELFLGLVPGLADRWEGASEGQVAELERLAGRALPGFYRWFLNRMGKSVGGLQFRSLDFSVERILSCYADGLVTPDDRFLMIGFETDDVMPLHLFYDFDYPTDDDARVVSMGFDGELLYEQFDTFREMLVWGQFGAWRINRLPQSCVGLFERQSDQGLNDLDRAMQRLGFLKPVPMGSNCAVYERPDAGMSAMATVREPPSPYVFFRVGANDVGTIRRILGELGNEMSVELKIKEWIPPLGDPHTVP